MLNITGKVISVILALVIYGSQLDIVGFLLLTFLVMVFLLQFIDPQSWGKVAGRARLGWRIPDLSSLVTTTPAEWVPRLNRMMNDQ
jgi:hypothetical protein